MKSIGIHPKKPKRAELKKARLACMAELKYCDARKAQARAKDQSSPKDKKVNDLILLQDTEK